MEVLDVRLSCIPPGGPFSLLIIDVVTVAPRGNWGKALVV